MGYRQDWLQKLARELDLSAEVMPGQPFAEVFGQERVLIEHHMGVTAYGSDRICVKVSYGEIQVFGSGLELMRMSKAQLIICGKIQGVTLIGGK